MLKKHLKFGKQWIVTTQGMETITGKQDPRKNKL
ncbi:helix-turn-helix domain-containing protein [Lactobacillus iners]|nr:helix-turn-helix domain-containing protein [Lactobacillus iners]